MKYLILILFLASCSSIPVSAPSGGVEDSKSADGGSTPPADATPVKKPAVIEVTCPKPGTYQAVDLAQPVTPRFLEMMKYLGIKKIIRYGDHPGNETLRGKIATPAEQKMIADAGFDLEVVFQHNNRWARANGTLYNTFNGKYGPERGKYDAEVMWKLYPNEERWWIGIDFDPNAAQLADVRNYVKAFRKVADSRGKKIGAYGSGYTTRVFFEEGLIHYRWISMSTGFRESKTQVEKKAYEWLQVINKVTINGVRKEMICGGLPIDFNYVR